MCSNRPAASLYMNRKRRSKSNPRKTRSKTKKPKFLSLRRKFPAEETKEIEELTGRKSLKDAAAEDIDGYELKLFPQQPENLVEDRESYDHENENVAVFFSAGDSSATTLTGLLDFSADHQSNSSLTVTNNHNITSRLRDLSPSAAYSEDPSPLVRNAFRSRERDAREETWVSLSEVVKEEEVSSSGGVGIQGLRLKLDYEEIIDAWSNKGSLYIDAETPQIVPDINHQFLWQQSSNNQEMNWGCDLGIWKVPEMAGGDGNGEMRVNKGQREASVLRYKQKRRNRLFSHKIRYQVRKLNAEKRPRLKGRFVKRS